MKGKNFDTKQNNHSCGTDKWPHILTPITISIKRRNKKQIKQNCADRILIHLLLMRSCPIRVATNKNIHIAIHIHAYCLHLHIKWNVFEMCKLII